MSDGLSTQDSLAEDKLYAAIASGLEFELGRPKRACDASNMFTLAFLAWTSFAEASTRMLKPETEAELFDTLFDYLKCYTIFPLDPSIVPR